MSGRRLVQSVASLAQGLFGQELRCISHELAAAGPCSTGGSSATPGFSFSSTFGSRFGSTIAHKAPRPFPGSAPPPSRWVPPVKPTPAEGITDRMRKYAPVTAGTRHRLIVARDGLHKGRPFMPLTVGIRKTGGRNNQGKVTVRGRGGGHKRVYRKVDFLRGKDTWGHAGMVQRLEYDPNRSGRIALIKYEAESVGFEGYQYILAPKGLKPGDSVMAGPDAEPRLGNALPVGIIPMGLEVHGIETVPGRGAALVRAAGTSAAVVGRSQDGAYTMLRFPSGEVRMINSKCLATIGQVSNPLHKLRILGKAGANRWLGRRPKVRGVAMSPPDHPHAGGRKGSPAMPSRSRTGVFAKGGYRTRRYNKNRLRWIVTSRHEARRKVRGY